MSGQNMVGALSGAQSLANAGAAAMPAMEINAWQRRHAYAALSRSYNAPQPESDVSKFNRGYRDATVGIDAGTTATAHFGLGQQASNVLTSRQMTTQLKVTAEEQTAARSVWARLRDWLE